MEILSFVVLMLQQQLMWTDAVDEQLNEMWTEFKQTHNKQYQDDIEESHRREIFQSNLELIAEHNKRADLGEQYFTLAVNEYTDLPLEAYSKQLFGLHLKPDDLYNKTLNIDNDFKYNISQLPDTVDWRTAGYVTSVKQQSACGSCWAFSAAATLESLHAKKTGKLVDLSVQNLVDCSREFENEGCDGGMPFQAFNYIADNHGIASEESYPYLAKDMQCRYNESTVAATCVGYKSLPEGDEQALMAAVANIGPISVCIDASHFSFVSYFGGVFLEPNCTTEVTHGVVIVGYGTDHGLDYWLIKNSWGVRWGAEGFLKMARNKGNMCGIASYATYPVLA